MDLGVVVVSWNVRPLLARCLRSVQASLAGSGLASRTLVVDSASGDGTPEMVRTEFPEIELIVLPENQGFAAACNVGIAALLSTGPAVERSAPAADSSVFSPGDGERDKSSSILLLNADTEVVGSALADMVAYLGAHPSVGVVGPQLRYPDGAIQPSRRRFPTIGTLFWESTPLEQLWPTNPWARRYHVCDRPDDVEQEVAWLVGACLLVRAEAIAEAGLLDAGYFLYFEELEWCQRIRQAGWRIVYLPRAQVVHHEGRSSEQVPLRRHLTFQRSKVRYAARAFGAPQAALLRFFLLAMYGWQFLVEGAKFLLGHRRPLRRQRMGIYAALLRDGLKPGPDSRSEGC